MWCDVSSVIVFIICPRGLSTSLDTCYVLTPTPHTHTQNNLSGLLFNLRIDETKKSERKWDPNTWAHTLHICKLSTEENINKCKPDGWKENILTFPKNEEKNTGEEGLLSVVVFLSGVLD